MTPAVLPLAAGMPASASGSAPEATQMVALGLIVLAAHLGASSAGACASRR